MGKINRDTLDFDTSQHVYGRASTLPFIGFENAEDLPSGWLYDIKRWCSPFDLKLPTLPKLTCPSKQGISTSEFFECGVRDEVYDLEVEHIEEIFFNHERQWIPNISHGWYYRYDTDYFYYGDNSRIQYVDPSDNVDGRNIIELDVMPMPGIPILASSFKRDRTTKVITYDLRVDQVGRFTGKYVNGVQSNTYVDSTNTILWDNINTDKREFILDIKSYSDRAILRFARDLTRSVGVVPVSFSDLGAGDELGVSDYTEDQIFYTERFPIVPDSFKLFVVNVDPVSPGYHTWVEWDRVDTYKELENEGISTPFTNYYLDSDIGRVVFKTVGSGIPADGTCLVAIYDTTLRVEYEEANYPTEIVAYDADVNPVSQTINQGFICITHEHLVPAKISLVTDKTKMQFVLPTTYGPVYIGNDWALLRAEVLSDTDQPVPNIEVTFNLVPITIGYIGGSSNGTSYGATNEDGYAYSSYQSPSDSEQMGFYATRADSVQGDTLVLDNEDAGLTMDDDIYLYKVLKDDPLLGATDLDAYLPELPNSVTMWPYPSAEYNIAYAAWRANVIQEYNLEDWNPNIPNGRKVVVYQWDSQAINPVVPGVGAFVPTRPLSIDEPGGRLTYPPGALLPSDPYYPAAYPPYYQDIGAYWIVCSKYIEIQASCFSPYYNRTIYSNIIRMKVLLPRYLLGEYINEQLYKIPFGWKLYESIDKNHAAGLDGATFLTINPHSGPYKIVDWTIDVNDDGVPDGLQGYSYALTGDWADAQWAGQFFSVTVL